MNQQCKVCGEPAAGFHFGAFTCEGCKSFFGRTYNNLSSISECKNNGECVINKKNRTACKACRLRKCLLVGMSKSGSRYGRRSNWFKIHCLLQEQQQQKSSSNNSSTSPNLLPNHFLPSHFLTNLCGNNKYHSQDVVVSSVRQRTTSSPSDDSGASSADLEENSLKDGSIESVSIESKTEKSSISSNKMMDTFRPKIEPLSPYLPTNNNCRSEQFFSIPPLILPPSIVLPAVLSVTPTGTEQQEPIDLSMKSAATTTTTTTATATITARKRPRIESPVSLVETKSVPLDLTLMRSSNTLLG